MPTMPDLSDLTDLGKLTEDVTALARDAAYVAVGFGVLGFQKAQVQRVELTNRLHQDLGLETRLGQVRANVSRSAVQIDGLLENASQFIESSLSPIEEQLPAPARDLAHRAHAQAREVRSQILGLVTSAA